MASQVFRFRVVSDHRVWRFSERLGGGASIFRDSGVGGSPLGRSAAWADRGRGQASPEAESFGKSSAEDLKRREMPPPPVTSCSGSCGKEGGCLARSASFHSPSDLPTGGFPRFPLLPRLPAWEVYDGRAWRIALALLVKIVPLCRCEASFGTREICGALYLLPAVTTMDQIARS